MTPEAESLAPCSLTTSQSHRVSASSVLWSLRSHVKHYIYRIKIPGILAPREKTPRKCPLKLGMESMAAEPGPGSRAWMSGGTVPEVGLGRGEELPTLHWHSASNYDSRIISFDSVRKEHIKARTL